MALMASMRPLLVQRSKPVIITPAETTPNELKYLSDVDDQYALQFQAPGIQYYKNEPRMSGKDPVTLIKDALAKALVFYYPFAGRIREGPTGSTKLVVECTGEGVPFVEADANVTLEELGDRLPPPLPWLDEFMHNVQGSDDIVDCPLMLMQVTRLACGGFIVAVRHNHVMADAEGIFQFVTAVAELATGKSTPTLQPVWERHLLTSTYTNGDLSPNVDDGEEEEEEISNNNIIEFPKEQLIHRSFFFGPKDISALKRHSTGPTTSFEVVAAAMWRSRTMALCLEYPDEEVWFKFIVNSRSKVSPPLPGGYYGNALVYGTASSTAGRLCGSPLDYAIRLVNKAKAEVMDPPVESTLDMTTVLVAGVARMYVVSDTRRSGFDEVDYGWGKPVYGGPAIVGLPSIPGLMSYYVPFENRLGEKGVVVPVCLPDYAMDRFVEEVEKLTGAPVTEPHGNKP